MSTNLDELADAVRRLERIDQPSALDTAIADYFSAVASAIREVTQSIQSGQCSPLEAKRRIAGIEAITAKAKAILARAATQEKR